jgi:hypothetical protein
MAPAFPTAAPTGCARSVPRRRPASAPIATAAQYQMDMERVQQYIRERVQLEDETYLLGVNDARSRQCYAEIQTFLVRKLQLEQARAAATAQQAATMPATRMVTPTAGDRVLLHDLDEYLDELDPTLFSAATTPASGRHGAAIDVPAGASYIRRMQEDAKTAAGLRPCQSSENLAVHATPRAGGAFKRVRSL